MKLITTFPILISLLMVSVFGLLSGEVGHVPDQQKTGLEKSEVKPVKKPNILFLLADDWGPDHASVLGDEVVKTPNFDALARQGILFTNAYVAVPSCTASRAGILTGQMPHRLKNGMNLSGIWNNDQPVYPNLLQKSGYHVGYVRKGWGPGKYKGELRNPAGEKYSNFIKFIEKKPEDAPFCFWFGSKDPHRGYYKQLVKQKNIAVSKIKVPPYMPDLPSIRADLADYYAEVKRFDEECGAIIAELKKRKLYDNTIIVMTGDHGLPFPRAKGHLYDSGAKVPLAIHWPGGLMKGQRRVADFISLTDLAPTFLEAAGLPVPEVMTGKSLMNIFNTDKSGRVEQERNMVFTERERHTWCHEDGKSYPSRALRTDDFLYIRNMRPYLYPAGHPFLDREKRKNPIGHVDCDEGPSKQAIVNSRKSPEIKPFYEKCFGKRPYEELYMVSEDPHQLDNLASDGKYQKKLEELRKKLDNWMVVTKDPRAKGETDMWDAPSKHLQPRADKQLAGYSEDQESIDASEKANASIP